MKTIRLASLFVLAGLFGCGQASGNAAVGQTNPFSAFHTGNTVSIHGNHPPLDSFYHGWSDIQTAPAIADELRVFPEVDDAVVLIERERAYVGVKLKPHSANSQDLKKRTRDKILYLQKGITQIEWTVQPYAFEHLKLFATDIAEGHPLKAHFYQFKKDRRLYERIF